MAASSTPYNAPDAVPIAAASEPARGITFGVMGLLALLVPMLHSLEVKLVGRLFVSELVLAALLPFMVLTRGRLLLKPFPAVFIAFMMAWLFSQVVTDLYRDTPSSDYLRGWAKIISTGICFVSLYLLINNKSERIVLYLAGLVIGLLLTHQFSPSKTAIAHPWKFGYAVPVTIAVFLFAVYAGKRFLPGQRQLPSIMATIIGLINLYLGFRSFGGVCILTAIYLAVWGIFSNPRRDIGSVRLSTVVLFSLATLMAGGLVVEAFSIVAKQGYLGEKAQRKFRFQGTGDFGLLLGGRQEIFVSARAVRESPLLGHGSWAKDPELTYHYAIFELRRALGYPTNEYVDSDLLPTHSHLFGAWVEAGIVGAIFWIWVLTIVLRALSILYKDDQRLVPVLALVAFLLIWDIPFSPFGAERRFITTFFIVAMMYVIERASTRTRESYKRATA